MSLGRLNLHGLGNGEPLRDIAFRNWFGASKVVDAQGRPKVVYHGTASNFDTFVIPSRGHNSTIFGSYAATRHAAFFAEDPEYARVGFAEGRPGGRVLAVYLRIENPMILTDGFPDDVRNALAAQGVSESWMWSQRIDEIWEMFDDDNGAHLVAAAKRAGYDGALTVESDARGKLHRAWVVFTPNQIKSANANSGAFSRKTDNILQGLGGLRWRR